MGATRNVTVMMASAKNEPQLRKQLDLQYRRIKYLVEDKIKVVERGTQDALLHYKVLRAEVKVGRVSDEIVQVLLTSDVVIGVVSARSSRVFAKTVYELGIRNMLRGEWILVTEDKVSQEDLPDGLRELAAIQIDGDEGGQNIDKWIAAAAVLASYPVPDSVIKDLKAKSDEYDGFLASELEAALQRVEAEGMPPPDAEGYIKRFDAGRYIKQLDPGSMLSQWHVSHPYSMWRVEWQPKARENASYTKDQMIGSPVLFDASADFTAMLGMKGHSEFPPRPDDDSVITREIFLDRIEDLTEPESFPPFLEDLEALEGELMSRPDLAAFASRQFRGPLRFKADHWTFPGKAFMPYLLARRTYGKTMQRHFTYLLYVFLEVA